jgi:hypothetical protein
MITRTSFKGNGGYQPPQKLKKMATVYYINPMLHLNSEKISVVVNTTNIYAVEYQDVEDGIKVEMKLEKRSLSFVMENSD